MKDLAPRDRVVVAAVVAVAIAACERERVVAMSPKPPEPPPTQRVAPSVVDATAFRCGIYVCAPDRDDCVSSKPIPCALLGNRTFVPVDAGANR